MLKKPFNSASYLCLKSAQPVKTNKGIAFVDMCFICDMPLNQTVNLPQILIVASLGYYKAQI